MVALGPLATPPARPRHALKDALVGGLELLESGPILNFDPKHIDAGARVWISR